MELTVYDDCKIWMKKSKRYRNHDLPAFICLLRGDRWWYSKQGQIHREKDLPVIIYKKGEKHWFKDGSKHREKDLPALIYSTGDQIWYKEGKWHREGNLPALIYSNGDKFRFERGAYVNKK